MSKSIDKQNDHREIHKLIFRHGTWNIWDLGSVKNRSTKLTKYTINCTLADVKITNCKMNNSNSFSSENFLEGTKLWAFYPTHLINACCQPAYILSSKGFANWEQIESQCIFGYRRFFETSNNKVFTRVKNCPWGTKQRLINIPRSIFSRIKISCKLIV